MDRSLTLTRKPVTRPRNCDDTPVVQSPSTMTVAGDAKVVLYAPDGRVLVRPIGFK